MKKVLLGIFLFGTLLAQGQSNDWWENSHFQNFLLHPTIVFGNSKSFVTATDSVNQKTYLAGTYNFDFGNLLYQYDGNQWIVLGQYSGIINTMCVYHGYLYVGSDSYQFNDTLFNPFSSGYLSRYDGQNWESINIDGKVTGLNVIEDTLYIGGKFDNAESIYSPRAVKYDGDNMYAIPNNPIVNMPNFLSINAFAKYHGDLFMGGVSPDVNDQDLLMYHDGVWQTVGEGIPGLQTRIDYMEVYQDELYIAGNLWVSQGTAGNGIQKWNGESWSQVGGGLNGVEMLSMLKFDDGLFVSGTYSQAGDVQVNGVARWDGTKWCGLHTDTEFQFIPGMFVLNNSLYMPLRQSETDPFFSDNSEVYKWIGGDDYGPCETVVGVEQINPDIDISIFPNPATASTNISSDNLMDNIRVFDLSGKLLLNENTNSNFYTLDLSGIKNGMYLLQIVSGNNIEIRKLVKSQ